MTPLHLRPSTLDEIVFEGRNKAYGAFDLRQHYNIHLRRALMLALVLFALMAAAPILSRLLWPAAPAPRVFSDKIIELDQVKFKTEPVKAEPIKEVAAPKPQAKTPPTFAVPTEVKPDNLVKDKPADPIPTVDAMPGSVNDPGTGGVVPIAGELPTVGGGGEGPGTTTAAPAKPEIFLSVEHMPEFAGGPEAMLKFLQKNMRYPSLALRNQVEGKVFVSFTVSATGDIVDVKVLKGLGYGTDEEAMRVVKLMPRWQPGAQNGRNVAVQYTLPITFTVR